MRGMFGGIVAGTLLGCAGAEPEAAAPVDVADGSQAPGVSSADAGDGSQGAEVSLADAVGDAETGSVDATPPPDGHPGAPDTHGIGEADVHGPEDVATSDVAPFVLDCATYCSALEAACGAHPQYHDTAECLAVCEDLPLGAAGDAEGNSTHCRYGRALLAADGGPERAARCASAGPTGGGVCGQPCDAWCALMAARCTSSADCAVSCLEFPTAASTDTSTGDSFACRFRAVLDGRCADAAPDGGSACVEPAPPGDTCAWPHLVDTLPYSVTASTTGAADDLSYEGGPCGGRFGGKGGQGAADQVIAWTPLEDSSVKATLAAEPPYDTILYVLTACDAPTESCIDKRDSVGFNATETLELSAKAGITLYFVVDAASGGDGVGAYTFTLTTP